MEETLDPAPEKFVDFGNISKITYDEYFGAALWQLNKAMESPYKSALKMGLLESYLDPNVNSELLCEKLKRSVFLEKDASSALDSYQIMINRVLDYYGSLKRNNTVELLRRCFYIKTCETETPAGLPPKNTYKQILLKEYLKKWNWSETFIETHNNYRQWGFSEVLALGRELHDYMIETYKRLSDYAKTKPNLKRKLTDRDLTVLGRKLFSFYSIRKNKIPFLKQPFEAGEPLENVTFHVTFDKSGQPVWSVYRGQLQKHKLVFSKNKLLKRGVDLPKILTWMLINRICDTRSNYYLIPNSVPVSLEEIQRVVKELSVFFSRTNIAAIPNKDLFNQPKVQKLFVLINFLSQPWAKKIEQITLLYSTSWGEFFCENYDEKKGILTILKYIEELPKLVTSYEGNIHKVFIPRGENKNQIQKKINMLILKNL
ncbi:MAG: class I adenylate cyclase [Nitrospinota bacterium]